MCVCVCVRACVTRHLEMEHGLVKTGGEDEVARGGGKPLMRARHGLEKKRRGGVESEAFEVG